VTLRGVSKLPPVNTWNKITMAIRAMNKPICRSRLTMNAMTPA
jgi:hypothetical protein